jgi:hypothetical protein
VELGAAHHADLFRLHFGTAGGPLLHLFSKAGEFHVVGRGESTDTVKQHGSRSVKEFIDDFAQNADFFLEVRALSLAGCARCVGCPGGAALQPPHRPDARHPDRRQGRRDPGGQI